MLYFAFETSSINPASTIAKIGGVLFKNKYYEKKRFWIYFSDISGIIWGN